MLNNEKNLSDAEFLLQEIRKLDKSSFQLKLVQIIDELVLLDSAFSMEDDDELEHVILGTFNWLTKSPGYQEFVSNNTRYFINARGSRNDYGMLSTYNKENNQYENLLQLASFFGRNGEELKNRLIIINHPLDSTQNFWKKEQLKTVKKMIKDTLNNIFSVVPYIKKNPEKRTQAFFDDIHGHLKIENLNKISQISALTVICLSDIFDEAVLNIRTLETTDLQELPININVPEVEPIHENKEITQISENKYNHESGDDNVTNLQKLSRSINVPKVNPIHENKEVTQISENKYKHESADYNVTDISVFPNQHNVKFFITAMTLFGENSLLNGSDVDEDDSMTQKNVAPICSKCVIL